MQGTQRPECLIVSNLYYSTQTQQCKYIILYKCRNKIVVISFHSLVCGSGTNCQPTGITEVVCVCVYICVSECECVYVCVSKQ